MMELVQDLFKPLEQISMDQKYQILDKIKASITILDLESIQKGDIVNDTNWRLMTLLNIVASQDMESKTHRYRLMEHLLGDFEDLMYTNSFIVNKLASISLRVLNKHLSHSPEFINNKGMMPQSVYKVNDDGFIGF